MLQISPDGLLQVFERGPWLAEAIEGRVDLGLARTGSVRSSLGCLGASIGDLEDGHVVLELLRCVLAIMVVLDDRADLLRNAPVPGDQPADLAVSQGEHLHLRLRAAEILFLGRQAKQAQRLGIQEASQQGLADVVQDRGHLGP